MVHFGCKSVTVIKHTPSRGLVVTVTITQRGPFKGELVNIKKKTIAAITAAVATMALLTACGSVGGSSDPYSQQQPRQHHQH